jgi:glycosyltransferase involved in cell wall biosynthesis
MNILILSSSHPYKMSGIIALEIFEKFKNTPDYKVKLLVKPYEKFEDANILSIQSDIDYFFYRIKTRLYNEMQRFFMFKKNRTINTDSIYSFFEIDETKTFYTSTKILQRAGFKPDVILVLFMTSFVSYKNLFEINKRTKAPIFIYMMDMAPITSGCHYSWDCKRYEDKCGFCPALFSETSNDQSRRNWNFKKKYIAKTDIRIIAATNWQKNQLSASSLYKNKPQNLIFIPTNEEMYKPEEQSTSRILFNLPLTKKVIFFGAVSLLEKRKGYHELVTVLEILKERYKKDDIHLAIAGNVNDQFLNLLPFDFTLLGYLNHHDLIKAYQASTLFLNTSIEDSGPTMINQAMMCGVPVVAFKMGVAPDLVIKGKTGYLAELFDCNDLANGIIEVFSLSNDEYILYKKNCRKTAMDLCSYNVVFEEFQNLFENVNVH